MSGIESLLALCSCVSSEADSDDTPELNADEMRLAIEEAVKDRRHDGEVLDALFPNGVPSDAGFYEAVSQLWMRLYDTSADGTRALLAAIWVAAVRRLPDQGMRDLLAAWIGGDADIWDLVDVLPDFLREVELPSDFAVHWFRGVCRAVAGDLAGGSVFEGLVDYALAHSDSAAAIFERYCFCADGLRETDLHVAAMLLGGLRTKAASDADIGAIVARWDVNLERDRSVRLRLCYYRSWRVPFIRGEATFADVADVISRAVGGSDDEVCEAFDQATKAANVVRDDRDALTAVFSWLLERVCREIPPVAKQAIAGSLRTFGEAGMADKLLVAVLPVPAESKDTWHEIGRYLAVVLRGDRERFVKVVRRVAEKAGDEILATFRDDALADLVVALGGLDGAELSCVVSELLFSLERVERRLALAIFAKTPVASLPDTERLAADERLLQLVLHEFVIHPHLNGDDTSRFLLMLDPLFREASDEVCGMMEHELVMQAINYPGSCYESWRALDDPSETMERALDSAGQYLDQLGRAKDSPATSFPFASMARAEAVQARDFAQRIQESGKEASAFGSIMDLFVHVDYIYGERLFVGSLGDEMGAQELDLQEFSHQMEVAHLETIDPEGMALRRIEAGTVIQQLTRGEEVDE